MGMCRIFFFSPFTLSTINTLLSPTSFPLLPIYVYICMKLYVCIYVCTYIYIYI